MNQLESLVVENVAITIFIELSEEIFDSEVILCLSNLQGGHSLQRSHDDQIDFLPKSEKDHFNI